MKLEVPTCGCVKAARQLSSVFPIPAKYRIQGEGTSTGVAFGNGYVVVWCDYCGDPLKTVNGWDMREPVEAVEMDGQKERV